MRQNPCRYCCLSFQNSKGIYHPSPFEIRCDDCKNLNEHLEYLKKHQKFDIGEPITSIDELLKQEWGMYRRRTKHIEVFKHMQLATVLRGLELGHFHKAVRKEEML